MKLRFIAISLWEMFFLLICYNVIIRNGRYMNFNLICTQDDPDFCKYENAAKERKVKFTIKQIFRDWWNSFLNVHQNYNIRDVVYKNVKKILQCKTFDLGY